MRHRQDDRVKAVVGLTGFSHRIGGFEMATDRVLQIDIPKRFPPRAMKLMQRDFEILAEVARDRPRELAALLEASASNDVRTAFTLAEKLRLREDDVKARGGGIIWGVVAAIVAADVLFDMRRFGLRM